MTRIERILAEARAADPSIDGSAVPIAARCVELLDADPTLSAIDLARGYLGEDPKADASWVAHISRTAVATQP